MSRNLDDNDRAVLGRLPSNPVEDTKLVEDHPRILRVDELLSASAERAMEKRDTRACTTGSTFLDERTGGLLPGWIWVVGADTNWGKSTWAVSVADENLLAGRSVLIVSVEDSEELYGDRLMLRRSRVSADNLRGRCLTASELAAVDEVTRKAEKKPAFLDARGKSAEWCAKQVAHAIKHLGVDLVIYDYLQEFRSERRQQDRRNEVSEVAKILRDPVKTAGKAGIILSQLTVTGDKAIPTKHDIRESRDVSNAAEVVALGFTPSKDMEQIQAGTRCMLLDKVKQGRKGIVCLKWDERSACFCAQSKRDDDPPDDYPDFDDGRF